MGEWPPEIIDQLGREPRIGDWYAECCIEDLREIKTAEELANLLEIQDDGWTGGTFWPDEKTALAEVDRP